MSSYSDYHTQLRRHAEGWLSTDAAKALVSSLNISRAAAREFLQAFLSYACGNEVVNKVGGKHYIPASRDYEAQSKRFRYSEAPRESQRHLTKVEASDASNGAIESHESVGAGQPDQRTF